MSGQNEEINIVVESAENIASIVEDIEKNKRVFIYFNVIEADNPNLILNKKNNAAYVYSESDSRAYCVSGEQVLSEFRIVLENEQILKIGYNLKESYIILKEQGVQPKNMMFDIGVAAYLLNSTSNNYNITNLMKTYLDIEVGLKRNRNCSKSCANGFI